MKNLLIKKRKMKKINNTLIELYKDKNQLLVLSILCYISYWLESLLPNDSSVIYSSAALIVAGSLLLFLALVCLCLMGAKNRKAAKKAAEKAEKEKQKQVALLNKEKSEI